MRVKKASRFALNGEAISILDGELRGADLVSAIEGQRLRNAELDREIWRKKTLLLNFGDDYEALQRSLRLGQERLGWLEQRMGSPENKLAAEVAAWERTVDQITASGQKPSRNVRMLVQTPLVMQLLEENSPIRNAIGKGGIEAKPHFFDSTSHPNITPEMRKQIPSRLVDPIAILDSQSRKGDVVFMLDLKDANGATVVVPIALSLRKGGNGVFINVVRTAYAKEKGGVPTPDWFASQANRNLRYVNQAKLQKWQADTGVQFPVGAVTHSASKKILTDSDLVKLKQQNPRLYQADTLGGIMGATTFEDNKAIIRFFKGANIDTAGHEMAHVLRRQFERMATTGKTSPELLRRYQALEERFGVADGKWSIDQEEAFANSFLDYLKTGDAPDPLLAGAFSEMRAQLLNIYGEADTAGVKVSPEVRRLLNSLLTVPVAEGKWQFDRSLAEINSGRLFDYEAPSNGTGPALHQLASDTPVEFERASPGGTSALEQHTAQVFDDLEAVLNDPSLPLSERSRLEIRNEVNAELAPKAGFYSPEGVSIAFWRFLASPVPLIVRLRATNGRGR